MSEKTPLRLAAPLMRHEFRRFAFTPRQMTLIGQILSLTWEDGIPAVRIPELKFFSVMTGMAESHVSTALRELHELQRAIVITEQAQGNLYSINPDTSQWQVTPRSSRSAMIHALNIIRELNGVPVRTDEKTNFDLLEAAKFMRIGATDSVAIPMRQPA